MDEFNDVKEVKKFNFTKLKLIIKALICFILVLILFFGTLFFGFSGGIISYGATIDSIQFDFCIDKLNEEMGKNGLNYGMISYYAGSTNYYYVALSDKPFTVNDTYYHGSGIYAKIVSDNYNLYYTDSINTPFTLSPFTSGYFFTSESQTILYANHDIKDIRYTSTDPVFFLKTPTSLMGRLQVDSQPILTTIVSLAKLLLPLLIGYLGLRKALNFLQKVFSGA